MYRNAATNGVCVACSAGKWSPLNTITSDNECQLCSKGKWSNQTGLTENAQCKDCFAGKWSSTEGIAADSSCNFCSSGKWSDVSGLFLDSQCTSCVAGKYDSAGSGIIKTAESICKICDGGQFSEVSSASCKLCPSGWHNFDEGNFEGNHLLCSECPGTLNSNAGATECTADVLNCSHTDGLAVHTSSDECKCA